MKPPVGRLVSLVFLGFACSPGPAIYEHAGFAMGTVVQLKVVVHDASVADAAFEAALAELARVERLATVHSDSSEVALLARAAGGIPVPVSQDLDRILRTAIEVARSTGGAFDPTIGPLLRAWGFPDAPHLPDSSAIAQSAALVGWERCKRSPEGWSLAEPGMSLDLGGVAKGYAVDRAADRLAAFSSGCLVSVGGDLAVRGTRPGRPGWVIGVEDPREPSRMILKLGVPGDRAVSTSGDYQRFVEVDGKRYHHLLDPDTGRPARGLRSVTVVGPYAELTDAWATAAFVLGPVEGLAALEAHPDLEGVLVEQDVLGKLVLHRTSGMAALELEP
ncbi:MAG: FAD:protein FMN transferase [bacterium]